MQPTLKPRVCIWHCSEAGNRLGVAIKTLFFKGIRSWLTSGSVEFPCELFSLASSAEVETLLHGFSFFKVQNAGAMPDNMPLFGLKLKTKEEFLSLLRGRGLDIPGQQTSI
jgi:hypothetical protein